MARHLGQTSPRDRARTSGADTASGDNPRGSSGSYYAGNTVIRATSPGLQDATFTIVSEGAPAFIAGTTPPVKPRPYVRFGGADNGRGAAKQDSTFGANNPTAASSETPGHAARSANDGDDSTFWQPQIGDANSWWQVDLERSVTMKQAQIDFPVAGNYRYKIETSNDGLNWTLAADETHATAFDQTRTDKFGKGVAGHLVRVTFAGKPAAISELEIAGHLTSQ